MRTLILILITASITAQVRDTNEVNKLNFKSDSLMKIGFYEPSLKLSKLAISLADSLNYKKGQAKALNIQGITYNKKGNYPQAINSLLNGLKIRKNLNNTYDIAATCNNLGMAYDNQKNYSMAIFYYNMSLSTFESIGNKNNTARCLNNIGGVYYNLGQFDKALDYSKKALAIESELSDDFSVAYSYGNIGLLYKKQGDLDSAISYSYRSLDMKQKLNDMDGVSLDYYNISQIFSDKKDYNKAKKFINQSLSISKEIGSKDQLSLDYQQLAKLDSLTGNCALSYKHYILHIAYRDSLINEEGIRKTTESEMNFNFEIKEALTKAESDKVLALSDTENKKQRAIILIGAIALILILFFAVKSYRNYVQKQKANLIITKQKVEVERQKKLVEDHQNDLLASIRYAQRLQASLMPTEAYIEKTLNRLKK